MLPYFLVAILLLYTVSIVILMLRCFKTVSPRLMLSGKRPDPQRPRAAAVAGGTALADPAGGGDGGDSHSRITGRAGTVVPTSFIGALGNIVINNAFGVPEKVGGMLTGAAPFTLASSAPSTPYAFDQLSTLFPSKG